MSLYKDSGVDIQMGNKVVDNLKDLAKSTFRPEVLNSIGGFNSLFKLKNYTNPVLVSGTDGVGTKLKYANIFNKHDTIGIDLVAMCVNDILTCGADPLFFLDYFATGKLDEETHLDVIKGITAGCIDAGCSLIGGETAEMPGFYHNNDYDLAGFAVGVVEQQDIINGSTIIPGDLVIGLASSGLHSNGYSLVRKLLDNNYEDYDFSIGDITLKEALLTPTIIYSKAVKLLKDIKIKGMAHITGGGLMENIPRILPNGYGVSLKRGSWRYPDIFNFLISKFNLNDDKELLTVFNCGIGFVLVIDPYYENIVKELLFSNYIEAFTIGKVVSGYNVTI